MGYIKNTLVCSRGTSKSFTIGSLFAPLNALLFRNNNVLVASASRFRGGKVVLKDSANLFLGRLRSQRLTKRWALRSLTHPASALKKEPDMWSMDFKSYSTFYTVPTNNEEAIRGLRARVLVIDERNSYDGEVIQRVYIPFLAVGGDFSSPAASSGQNQVFYVGTIDYTYKDWYKDIAVTEDHAKVQFLIQQAMMKKDWETYDMLRAQHGKKVWGNSFSLLRYDYTDLLIPTKIGRYCVKYPGAIQGKHIKADERDSVDYIYTYPVEKAQLEKPLDDGIVDPESWEAENRNVFIQASGTLYPPVLLERATGPIFSEAEEKKRGWFFEKEGGRYTPPVLFDCKDPCVLGIDVARSTAFTAFVIIRVGIADVSMYQQAGYSLATHSGHSQWSNVIWAEQHQHMTIRETIAKIDELRTRYNIVKTSDIRGIVMDAGGGGTHVRDELANPSPPVNELGVPDPEWKSPQRVYDPLDKEYEVLNRDPDAWPGLNLLRTTAVINQELVSFTRAHMDAGMLLLAPFRSREQRKDPQQILLPGYLGVQTLKTQLLRIQARPTPSGKNVQYVIPGKKESIDNQKDMFMAFLYAGYALREFVLRASQPKPSAEPVAFASLVRPPRSLGIMRPIRR